MNNINQKSFDFLSKIRNHLEERKNLVLVKRIRSKLENQLVSLHPNLEFEVCLTPQRIDVTLIDSVSDLLNFPQELIFKAAKNIEKLVPKNKDIKIYSKLKNNNPHLEISLNEELEKHSNTFQKIDLITGIKANKKSRKRIATINVLRRERLSAELRRDLGDQELQRRQLYLEERLVADESFQKIIVFVSILVFGSSSAITKLTSKKSELTLNKTYKTEDIKSSKNNSIKFGEKSQRIASKIDYILDRSILIATAFLAIMLVIGESQIIIDILKKKEQLSIIKYALEMNKYDSEK
ncbi:MAG: hypothetical protein HC852_18500 [Acaryochloridaceae cyanobacterium RU_4_10]|nr:hypothetical protein [Acaryochloridaceae cyanobacterium RU_4_10]